MLATAGDVIPTYICPGYDMDEHGAFDGTAFSSGRIKDGRRSDVGRLLQKGYITKNRFSPVKTEAEKLGEAMNFRSNKRGDMFCSIRSTDRMTAQTACKTRSGKEMADMATEEKRLDEAGSQSDDDLSFLDHLGSVITGLKDEPEIKAIKKHLVRYLIPRKESIPSRQLGNSMAASSQGIESREKKKILMRTMGKVVPPMIRKALKMSTRQYKISTTNVCV